MTHWEKKKPQELYSLSYQFKNDGENLDPKD